MLLTRFKFPKSHFFLNEKRSQYRPRTSLQLILKQPKNFRLQRIFEKCSIAHLSQSSSLVKIMAKIWVNRRQNNFFPKTTKYLQNRLNKHMRKKKFAPMNTKHMMFSKNYQKEPLIFTVVEKNWLLLFFSLLCWNTTTTTMSLSTFSVFFLLLQNVLILIKNEWNL